MLIVGKREKRTSGSDIGRVQSEHEPELGHVKRGGRRRGEGREGNLCGSQETQKRVTKRPGNQMVRLYREGQPRGGKLSAPGLQSSGYASQEGPVTGGDWGMLGEPGGQVLFDDK